MKKSAVEHMYSTKVAELLNQGWRIHTSSMSNYEKEVTHIDLTNGSEIRRVLMYRNTYTDPTIRFPGITVVIRVCRWNYDIAPGWKSHIWNEGLEVLSEIKLAEMVPVTRDHPEGWYTDAPTTDHIMDMWSRRSAAQAISAPKLLGTAYKEVALRWLRKQYRMKNTKLEDISEITRHNTSDNRVGYKIVAKHRIFYIHA